MPLPDSHQITVPLVHTDHDARHHGHENNGRNTARGAETSKTSLAHDTARLSPSNCPSGHTDQDAGHLGPEDNHGGTEQRELTSGDEVHLHTEICEIITKSTN